MSCNIITGYTVGQDTRSGDDAACVNVSPGKVALITPETPQGTRYTRTFTVPAGDAVLIEAFNLVPEYHVYVNRVVRSSECARSGCACDANDLQSTYKAESSVAFRSRMTLGNNSGRWSLIDFTDVTHGPRLQLLITIPGMYELELEDPDAQLAQGLTWIDYQTFRLDQVGFMPSAYQAGIN